MGEVRDFNEAFSWPIARLADCFGIHRQTLTRRIKEAQLPPAGTHRGNPTYHIREVARLLYEPPPPEPGEVSTWDHDPELRKAWYQSENYRVKYEESVRRLIPATDHVRDQAEFAKTVLSVIDIWPDRLEREDGLPPEVIVSGQRLADDLRESIRQRLLKIYSEEDTDDSAGEAG
ncbi:MAG: DUF1441 family protein [Pseudomonadota bacterium]